MGNPTATLEPENFSEMYSPGTQLEDAERGRAAALKFTHPSGSRPLEGYTIKRGVGRGGFGEVYFATSDAGKEVALKLIRRNLDVELRGVTQCLNLKHSNLIALYDIRTDEMGDQWVIMEYVSGESLEDVIDRNPNGMPVEEALWWMRGMCAGVAYLHDHGIVHRDLKPGNIFSDEDTVKIGDYGLAKFISCSRRSGQTESVGTVHYMAPEIANGRYGREIDTYALGIILFEMLTGRVPFEGESVGEVLMKHLTAEPDLTILEQPFRGIVERALAKDPNVRIDTVSELVAMLPGGDVASTPFVRPASQNTSNFSGKKAADAKASVQPALNERLYNVALESWKSTVGTTNSDPNAELEEPLMRAARSGFDYVRRRWVGDGVPPMPLISKVALVIALIWAGTMFLQDAFNSAIQFAVVYAIYYAIWVSLIKPSLKRETNSATPGKDGGQAKPQAAQAVARGDATDGRHEVKAAPEAKPMTPGRRVRVSWRERAYREIANKPLHDKLQELVGSMLLAAVFCATAAFVGPLLSPSAPTSENVANYLWLAMVGTLGSWGILIPAKFAEGKLEDYAPMRLILLLIGGFVGIAAWYLSHLLLIATPSWGDPMSIDRGFISNEILKWPKASDGLMVAPQYFIAYFAFLFMLPRWWRQTEFTRSSRVSLWWIMASAGLAWLLHFLWWFPQPQGMMVAGIIALTTQLSSPWMPPSQRKALAAEVERGVV